MNEAEILEWMRIPMAVRPLLPRIIDGMAGVAPPETPEDELRAFGALLRCAGPAGSPIFVPQPGDHIDNPARKGAAARERQHMGTDVRDTSRSRITVTVTCPHGLTCVVRDAAGGAGGITALRDTAGGVILHELTRDACDGEEFEIVREHLGDRGNAVGWLIEDLMTLRSATQGGTVVSDVRLPPADDAPPPETP